MRHIILIITALFITISSQAQTSDLQLVNLERSIHQVTSAFHMYSLEEGGKQARQNLSQSLTGLQQQIAISSLDAQSKALATQYQQMAQSMAEGNVGQTDLYISNDMRHVRKQLLASLQLARSSQLPSSPDFMASHLATLMQDMLAQYVELADYAFGLGTLGDSENRITIPEKSALFSAQLKQLQTLSQSSSWKSEYQKIDRKWAFLNKQINGYQKRTAPFAIARFSEQITRALDNIRQQSTPKQLTAE